MPDPESLWTTEATVGAVTWDVDLELKSLETVPLGRPLLNARVFILDPQLRLTPIGAPGELHIGGAGVARGYINRADATAEKLFPIPSRVTALVFIKQETGRVTFRMGKLSFSVA